MIITEKDLQMLNSLPALEPDSGKKGGNELKIDFDGTTVLCRVCGDKASGFHYGVHSCEGCKGFFRRSIQQKIQYRPCSKNQQCSILRINRNRCQYCRLKKCIAVGMSRDAVRFGRVPKREKAKILAAMQKVNANSQDKALTRLSLELEDEIWLLNTIVSAHEDTCEFTREKVGVLAERANQQPAFGQCPPQLACPLNPGPNPLDSGGNSRIMEDFSERFSPAIRGVVEFAKRIPGFNLLAQDDQVTLLKAGVFEVLLVRLACMFDAQNNSMICLNGQCLQRDAIHSASNALFLLDSMFDFAERLNSLQLADSELGVFSAVVLIAADRPGLRNTELVQKVHKKLTDVLQKALAARHPENPSIFNEVMKKIPDLRTLNTLHSEKLLAYKMEPNNQTCSGASQPTISESSVSNHWPQYAALLTPGNQLLGETEHGNISPSQNIGGNPGSEWGNSDYNKDPFGSPCSDGSGAMFLDDGKSPVRSSSFSSTRSYDLESIGSVEHGHIAEFPPLKKPRDHTFDHGASSGDESYVPDSPVKIPYPQVRRADSPIDSGIESGKEHGHVATPNTSVCSSPRSLEEKVKEVSECEEKHDSRQDMPVLKRALQAPPLVNTNLMMEDVYKHHKKFRAARRESESPTTSQVSSVGGCTQTNVSHANAHSTLIKTLERPPRFLNEQQIKRTDLIHNIIMRTESIPPTLAAMAPASATSSMPVSATPSAAMSTTAHSNIKTANGKFFYNADDIESTGISQTYISGGPGQPPHKIMVYPSSYYIPPNTMTVAGYTSGTPVSWPFLVPQSSAATGTVASASCQMRAPFVSNSFSQAIGSAASSPGSAKFHSTTRVLYDTYNPLTSVSAPLVNSRSSPLGFSTAVMTPAPSQKLDIQADVSDAPLNLSKKSSTAFQLES
ncbi:nuclear hormone receptor E75-like isoform X1 [Limulus polyphemus]|uniref:Nuclear hormone receptor E75-like isoform X1 n=1 Tax=Limulus polyphemus TaxID=6850 RepID=A0ABM1SMP9_LIMPO|nr:nuclear hormone receptor E75-like isoform X1 [Limulus polyphemus]